MSMKVGSKPPELKKPELKKPELKAQTGSTETRKGGGSSGDRQVARPGYSSASSYVDKPAARNAKGMPDLGASVPQNTVLTTPRNVQSFSATQTQQVATTTTPASTPEAARAQAEADVTLLAQRNHPLGVEPRDVEGLISAHANDPEYVSQLMGVLNDQGEFSSVVAAFNEGTGSTPEGRQAIMAGVRLALDRGTLPQSTIDEVAQHPIMSSFTDALRTAQAAGGDPAAIIRTTANSTPELRAAAVETLNATAATAQANLTELNQQLSRELNRYGPAMTPEQRQAFIADFKSRHPEYQTAQGAQDALGAYVRTNMAQLRSDALANPAAATSLATAMESLAGSTQNAVVTDVLKDPQLTAALRNAAGAQNFDTKVLEPAVGTLAAEGALSAGTDRAAQAGVAQQLNELYSSLSQVPGLADNSRTGLNALRDTASALRAYANGGSADALFQRIGQISDQAGSTSGLGKAMAGANFLLGAAMITEGVLQGDPQQLMSGLVQTASNANAIGYGLELASKALPNIVSKGLAASVTGLTEKVSGVLGVITNTISFLDQMGHLDNDSDRIKAAGSLASAVGSAMLLVPGMQIPGAVLLAVGTAAGLLGDWQEGQEAEARNQTFDAEALDIMRRIQPPIDANLLNTLSQMSPEEVSSVQGKLGMTPQQWVQLAANNNPGLLSAVNQNGPHLMEQLSSVFGLHDFASAQGFMSELAPPGTPPELVNQLFRDIASFPSDPRQFYDRFVALMTGQPENLRPPTPTPPSATPTPTPGPSTPTYNDVLNNMLGLLNERR